MSVINDALIIATETLRERYTDVGICAGASHFNDLWIRDCCYASWGALELGDYHIVKQSLETILNYTATNGQVPVRIGQPIFLLKFLFNINPKYPKARYKDDKGVSFPIDSHLLTIILMGQYIEKTQDLTFLGTHIKTVNQIFSWCLTQTDAETRLIHEGYYAGWADSLKRQGWVSYSNVLWAAAIQTMIQLSKFLKTDDLNRFRDKKEQVVTSIYTHLFNGDYLIDHMTNKKKCTVFSTDANNLAIVLNILNHEDQFKIQSFVQENKLDRGYTIKGNYPNYPTAMIYNPFKFINLADYHNGIDWLWLGCIDCVAKATLGQYELALNSLTRMSQKIVEFQGVYEVYDNGAPVNRLFYKSEQWFAWSSGLFVWAAEKIIKRQPTK